MLDASTWYSDGSVDLGEAGRRSFGQGCRENADGMDVRRVKTYSPWLRYPHFREWGGGLGGCSVGGGEGCGGSFGRGCIRSGLVLGPGAC